MAGWSGCGRRLLWPEGHSSPESEYDIRLNDFFASAQMRSLAARTQHGYARDLAALLTFLCPARGRTPWDQATEEDHLAYLHWRRHDVQGPKVPGATWNRGLAAVNQFYRWAVAVGQLEASPIPQRWRRRA